MPAASSSLAGGAAAGQTSPERVCQTRHAEARTCAPTADQVRVPGCSEPRGYAGVVTQPEVFSPSSVTGQAAMNCL